MRMSRFGLVTAAVAACRVPPLRSPPISTAAPSRSSRRDEQPASLLPARRRRLFLVDGPGREVDRHDRSRRTPLRHRRGHDVQHRQQLVGRGAALAAARGSRGIRGEVMSAVTASATSTATPAALDSGGRRTVDPLHTSVTTTTLMFNGYYDLGQLRPLRALRRRRRRRRLQQDGRRLLSPAIRRSSTHRGRQQVVAGLVADGGRGRGRSPSAPRSTSATATSTWARPSPASSTTCGFTNPKVRIDDLTAHEFKVGLRFAFGGGAPCCAA